MHCAAYQFINCAAFHELRNISPVALRTCNNVRVKVRVCVMVSSRLI